MGKLVEEFREIAVIVKSGEKMRLFTTNRFSIRGMVIHLQRYNHDAKIIKMGYLTAQPTVTNEKWIDFKEVDTSGWLLPFVGVSYREMVNEIYKNNLNNAEYPSKSVLRGVNIMGMYPITQLEREIGLELVHPVFVSDEYLIEKQIGEPANVLQWYEGKRISRRHNGELRKGYYLTRNRREGNHE